MSIDLKIVIVKSWTWSYLIAGISGREEHNATSSSLSLILCIVFVHCHGTMSPDMPCLKKGQIQDNSHWVVLPTHTTIYLRLYARGWWRWGKIHCHFHIIKALVRCVTHFHSHVSFHFHGHQSNTSVTLEKNEAEEETACKIWPNVTLREEGR